METVLERGVRISKVGGSLLTSGNVLNVIGRVVGRDYLGNKLVLVVSAMKGVTDLLIRPLTTMIKRHSMRQFRYI
ncbi:hypothetical protein [Vulcanisaeta sp. JCM 16161]|uniref:hypothetical protein n=1 Tax=Vulcanisaeta sp. JCM 16161 TaxID=1295372 RepID=UPI001FB2A7C4|nr:hypothetical protein [Vulcanisaeta sp. JCM 16161]